MEEWKEYKLGELITLNSGGTPDKNNKSYWDGDIPWISAKFMYDDYLYSSELKISQDGLTSGSRLAPKGSILLLTRGSGLFYRIPVCYTMRDLAYNQDVKCIESKNKELVSTEFLFYWLMGNKDSISAILETTGIGAGKIDTNRLKNVRISLPPNEYQQILIGFAESIMHKIEVNRRINDNLEQQAQALFRTWFLDFEPFKNGEFVESELGMIPKGWRVGQIKDICKFENGFAFKSDTYTTNGVYKVVTIKNVQDGYLDTEGANLISDIPNRMPDFCRLNTGEVLLSLTGNVGRCSLVNEDNLLLNQRVAKIKPHVESDLGYIYTLFRMPDFKERLISIARGTAQANLSPVETSKLSIVIPPTEIMKRYSVLSTYTYNKIICCMKESRRLAELRDTLLPKLMSGELKVNEIDDIL
jgi:type I restriction enzyme S subunit